MFHESKILVKQFQSLRVMNEFESPLFELSQLKRMIAIGGQFFEMKFGLIAVASDFMRASFD